MLRTLVDVLPGRNQQEVDRKVPADVERTCHSRPRLIPAILRLRTSCRVIRAQRNEAQGERRSPGVLGVRDFVCGVRRWMNMPQVASFRAAASEQAQIRLG